MSKIFSILVAVFVAWGSVAVFAQSGQGSKPSTGGKINQRPERAKPTPTPTPQVAGEQDQPPLDDGEAIVVDTSLVTIPVRVLDRKGRFIAGLTQPNFKVFEDNVEQEIALFSNDAQPFTVVLMLDMSYSTKFKISEIQSSAITFIDQLRRDDRVIVISFDEEIHVLCEATNDRNTIYRAIKNTRIATGTSVYEAVDLAINNRLRKIEGRKALVLFSDGVDTTSRRTTLRDNLQDALEIDTIIYPIRYDTFADVQRLKNTTVMNPFPTGGGPPPGSTPPTVPTSNPTGLPFPLPSIGTPSDKGTTPEEYQVAEDYLNQLAINTGGRIYFADSLDNLSGAFSKIASELREFYSLGYYPKDEAKPGKVRRIKVKTDQEKVAVKARDSYVVPSKRTARLK